MHGREPGAEHVGLAALTGCDSLDRPRGALYADLVLASLGEVARAALEALVQLNHNPFITESARRQFELGRMEERRSVLLKLLVLRFGDLPPDVRTRIELADEAQLELWLERVLTAQSIAMVLASDS